ncbi:hypothetical protein BD324DRAFT_652730 [Kockovaella imperatae]|uniref:GCN5-related N-acetyltransferase Rv2170-like domain-containing protein n=1 Tax=Kockovaella imperatae TaxID=4999 RepID=A0A1Y1UAG1_9TREE|nr:hypothetical protein BD324DRAFT_652730 [Kockovaella imperatae]ORX35009.1 hypothetical protein BD324DRAFT_652730 [Kockovaella imperatae]
MASPTELHPHSPQSLLPLLALYLPYSLPIYSSITCGPLVSPTAASPDDQDSAHDSPWDWAWATFSPSQLECTDVKKGRPGAEETLGIFACLVQCAGHGKIQTRAFCNVEADVEDPNVSEGQRESRKDKGLSVSQDLAQRYVEICPDLLLLGATHEWWTRGVHEALGKEVVNGMADLWIEPEQNPQASSSSAESSMVELQRERLLDDGSQYIVEEATDEDCQLIQEKRDIQVPLPYYLERKRCITAIRHVLCSSPKGTDLAGTASTADPAETTGGRDGKTASSLVSKANKAETVALIMTHAAGDQGALYVHPEHRRRGLAKWIVQANLARERKRSGGQVRGHVWVMRGNEASEALWRSMGWKKYWAGQWIVLRAEGIE